MTQRRSIQVFQNGTSARVGGQALYLLASILEAEEENLCDGLVGPLQGRQ